MTGRPAHGSRVLLLVRAGNLALRADPSIREPYRARFGRYPPRVGEDGRSVKIEYPRGLFGTRSRREQGTVVLDASVPWKLEGRGMLRYITADLGAGILTGLDALGGVTGLILSLPPPSGQVALRFAGVSDVTIHRPKGVEVGIRVKGGASRLRLDDQVFRAVGGETVLRSPGYEKAADRYEVEVLRGASDLTVDAAEAPRAVPGRTGRALATVLFTDIVGSTDRARELGDSRWREVLDRHDRTARRLVEDTGGELVKTTGDGILAAFDTPGPAIVAATAFRREMAGLDIEIRAGLHTGEVEHRGGDVGGIAVHIASRIMGAAAPGEVLVSRTVRDLVAGADVRLEDRGTHALKGVGDGWQLFAVVEA
jgi:class 3 adenylate cyclase